MRQELSGGEVFQIFVVRDNIYGGGGAFQVMSPGGECLKDHQELLVMSIVVQLRSGEGAGVKGDGWISLSEHVMERMAAKA